MACLVILSPNVLRKERMLVLLTLATLEARATFVDVLPQYSCGVFCQGQQSRFVPLAVNPNIPVSRPYILKIEPCNFGFAQAQIVHKRKFRAIAQMRWRIVVISRPYCKLLVSLKGTLATRAAAGNLDIWQHVT